MLRTLEYVSIIVTGGEMIIGILGNGFIGLTICNTCIKNRKLLLFDLILTSLAFSRIILLWLMIGNMLSVVIYLESFNVGQWNYFLTCSWFLTNHVNTWLTTCLIVFYFLKIANFSYPFFLWLKWRLSKVIFLLLLFSVLFFFMIFPFPCSLETHGLITHPEYQGNMTGLLRVSKNKTLHYMVLLMVGSLPPFSISLLSFFLLILSLWRHKKNMKLSDKNSNDPKTKAHFRAMKTVFSFLVLFTINLFAFYMSFWGYFSLMNNLAIVMFVFITGTLYHSCHAYVLIWGNNKMRKAFLRIVWHLKHSLNGKILPTK